MNWVKPSVWLPPLLLGALSISACSTMTNGDKQVMKVDERKTITPSPSQMIVIKTPDVPVHIKPGTDQQIQVHLHGTNQTDDPFVLNTKQQDNELRIALQRVGNKPSIEQTHHLQLDIEVPKDQVHELSIQTASGDIVLNDYHGNLLQLNTASGKVKLEDVSAATTIKTVTGPVDFETSTISKDVEIKTASGDLNVYLPSSATFVADIESGQRYPKIEFALHNERTQENSIRGTVGSGGPLLRLDTQSGDLKVYKN